MPVHATTYNLYIYIFILKSKDDSISYFNEENLLCCTLDLFLTGTETAATTIRWALLYMAVYPKIQGRFCNGLKLKLSFLPFSLFLIGLIQSPLKPMEFFPQISVSFESRPYILPLNSSVSPSS